MREPRWRIAVAPLAACLGVVACKSSDNTTLNLVTGGESDTFTRSPAPVRLRVDEIQLGADGGRQTTTLASSPLPATTLDLGSVDEAATGEISVTGLDDAGVVRVFGATPPALFGDIANGTVPIFVQRTGEFARLPSGFTDSRLSPTMTVLESRYLFVGAGKADGTPDASVLESSQIYDFLLMSPATTPPTMPLPPLSIVNVGTIGWLIASDGGSYFDFSSASAADVTLPSGSFDRVAGGATVTDANGASYVVGGSRLEGAPSAWVLKVDPNDSSNSSYAYGNPSWISLASARLGATATWAAGFGLVVVGGSSSAAAVEVVGSGATAGVPLSYPADDSTGAGAAVLDATHVLVAGGVTRTGANAGVRVVDLQCSASCAVTRWPSPPKTLTASQVFVQSDGTNVILVGSEPGSGQTFVYALSATGARTVPTKVAHSWARAIVAPTGSLVLFGGRGEIESFTP